MKVSLVATVLNEEESIDELLAALDALTLKPDEALLIDGGSTDSTLEKLQEWGNQRAWVNIGCAPGANIAAGRNLAIEKAAGPIIAVTDGGARPEPDWLEKLVAPLLDESAHVAMGFSRPDARGRFQRMVGCLNIPDVREIKPAKFMPSSRSVAFYKQIWSRAGRYPEWLDYGEDMHFNHVLRRMGAKMEFRPEAVVSWRMPPDLRHFAKQYFRYARGDAIGGMYIPRHALRFFAYSAMFGLIGAWLIAPWALAIPAVAALAWLFPAYRRAIKRLSFGEFLLAIPALMLLTVVMDFAKMAGYFSGLFGKKAFQRIRPQPTPENTEEA